MTPPQPPPLPGQSPAPDDRDDGPMTPAPDRQPPAPSASEPPPVIPMSPPAPLPDGPRPDPVAPPVSNRPAPVAPVAAGPELPGSFPGSTPAQGPPPAVDEEPWRFPTWLKWVLLIPLWSFLVSFLLLPLLGSSNEEEVVLFRFSKAIYLWPIIVVGIAGGWLVDAEIVSSVRMSWCFNVTVFLVVCAMMYDLPRNTFFIVVLVLAIIGMGLWFVQTKTPVDPLAWIHRFFVNMDPHFDRGGARVLSWLLIPLVLHAIVHARIDGKVRITYNEIEFHKFGDVSDSITRFGKRIKLRVADYLELIPGLGGGSLVIMNDEGEVIERVTDVVCIVPRWPRISQILETWQTRELRDPEAKIAQT